MGSKRKASTPVRWQPHAELTAAATLGASLLGGAPRSGADMVAPPAAERNLLSRFKGDANPQSKSARPAPSLALSLRVGSEEEETHQNRPASATIRCHHGSPHPSLGGRGGSGPAGRVPQQPVHPAAAPLPPPRRAASLGPGGYAQAQQSPNLLRASAGLPPPPPPPQMRAPPSVGGAGSGPQLAAEATRHHCDMCSFYEALLEALRGQLWSSREELEREQRKAWQLQVQLNVATGSSAGGSLLVCPACWVRPATVVLAPHGDGHLHHLCLCRRCLAATHGDPVHRV